MRRSYVEPGWPGEKGLFVSSASWVAVLVLAVAASAPAAAQAPSGPTTPRSPGSFGTTPFMGGVPTGTATAEPVALSLGDAIARALQQNLGVLTSREATSQASGARWVALGQLLPNVNGRVSETREKVNLAAFGFPLPAGVPALVGPFNVFDARVFLSQSVLDLSAINDAHAATHGLSAARYSYKSARDLVVLVTANVYLQALASTARAESARAQLETAQALYRQALDLKENGLVAGIDVLRAQVQVSTFRQRATSTANDSEKAKLQLARVIGLPVGQPLTLSDELPYTPVPEMTLEQALDRAYRNRPDYQAGLERVRATEAARSAAMAANLPSVSVTADYGRIGLTVGSAQSTYNLVGAVKVPIFNGGRNYGRLLEADAELRARRAEAEDLKVGVYYDVRTAFLDLQAGDQLVKVAADARRLAADQLTQARDRFAAGVTDNIEVVQAQETVALASEQYIAGLYSYNFAKAALARALGVAEDAVRQYLGGSR
jgi:outer membrane protein TolC